MNGKFPDFRLPHHDLFVSFFGDRVFAVGGTVRDYFIQGRIAEEHDADLLVVEHSYEEIEAKLASHGKINTVGKSFAVAKFSFAGRTYDISVPRRDRRRNAESHSHRNFQIECGPHISLREDLERRDFTCNSLALRLSDGELFDPFAGLNAIRQKLIVMTNPEFFFDDPLRLLRAARFASVLGFAIAADIYRRAKEVALAELSAERIGDELFRLLLESSRPSVGLQEYHRLTVLDKIFPALASLTLVIQDAEFHPEADEQGHHTVWAHALLAVDIAAKVRFTEKLDDARGLALMLAALLHDTGKAVTTRWEFKHDRMVIASPFHDSRGVNLAEEFLDGLRVETKQGFPLKKMVLKLVQYHHRLYELYRRRQEISFKALSRLIKDMEGEDRLLLLLDFVDRQAREVEPLASPGQDELCRWFLAKKEEFRLSQDAIKPLILGRDLLSLGIPPGVEMGQYLKRLYELQLDGEFSTRDQGLALFQAMRSK